MPVTRWQNNRAPRWALVFFAVCAAASCVGDDPEPTSQGANVTVATVDPEAWCESMLEDKASLRAPYADLFAQAPDGQLTPSSALLSLDGSPEATSALRDYLADRSEGAPESLQMLIGGAVERLDELSAELAAAPDEPGRSALAGMGIVGMLAELDEFSRENCGATF